MEHDFAFATCGNGHTYRISSTVHEIAADGMLSPSYSCPSTGCTYHVSGVRLAGWDRGALARVVR